MPTYFYTAKSFKGESKSGTRAAKDKSELAKLLRAEGYVLISAGQESEVKKTWAQSLVLPTFLQRVSLADKMLFTRNLQVMVSAGIPLPRSLKILAVQAKSKKLKKALEDTAEEITKGKSFSQGLALHPKIFSELFQNMVKVGEEAGTLEEVLKILTQQMEREHTLKSKIKGAMMYPAVIIVAMFGIGIIMLITVVPKLADTFDELGIELPVTTQLIIGVGTFLANFWYLIPIIVVFLIVAVKMLLSVKPAKKILDKIFLKAPIISPIVKKTNAAYTVRTLGSLISSGVPIVRSLEIISRSLSNTYFKKAIQETADRVRKGAEISESLKQYGDIYPPLVSQMIKVGEETGKTSDILKKLAEFFEEEVGNLTKNLASVIEPVLMLIIGAAVGFFAVSMIQPMYSMLGTL